MDDLSAIHCEVCHSGLNENKLLLCDKCDKGFHTYCLKPRLHSLPEGNWFCQACSLSIHQSNTNMNGDTLESSNQKQGETKPQIQCIISCLEMTPSQWKQYLVKPEHSTMNLLNGSLWCNDDIDSNTHETSHSSSASGNQLKQKRYLIKWANYSYLHLSWELESDLLHQLGSIATTFLDKFAEAMNVLPLLSQSWYPNLRMSEFVSPEFKCIDKVVDFLQGDDSAEGHYKAIPVAGLHGTNCSVAVKWRGYGYSLVTYEEIADLQSQSIEYQSALRQFLYEESFYRQDVSACPEYCTQLTRYLGQLPEPNSSQRARADLSGRGFKSFVKAFLDTVDIENKHQFHDAQTLKRFQWDGIRWLLHSFADDGRGALLADEARTGKKTQVFAFLDILLSLRSKYIHGTAISVPDTSNDVEPSAAVVTSSSTTHSSSSTEIIDLCEDQPRLADTGKTNQNDQTAVEGDESPPAAASQDDNIEPAPTSATVPTSATRSNVRWDTALRGSFLIITTSSAPQKLESLSAQLLLWSGHRAVRYYGSPEEKRILVEAEFKYLLDAEKTGFKPQCVFVSYDDFTKDFSVFQSIEWSVVVCDKRLENDFVITSSGNVKTKSNSRCKIKSLTTYLKTLEKVFMFVLLDASLSLRRETSDAQVEDLFIALNFLDPVTYSDREHLVDLLKNATAKGESADSIPSLMGRVVYPASCTAVIQPLVSQSHIVTSSSVSFPLDVPIEDALATILADSEPASEMAPVRTNYSVVMVEPTVSQLEADLQLLLIQAPWLIRLHEKVNLDAEVFEYDSRFGPSRTAKRAATGKRPLSAENSDALYLLARQLRQQSSLNKQGGKLLLDVAQRMVGRIDAVAKKSLLSLVQREYPKIAKIIDIIDSRPDASVIIVLQFRHAIDVIEAVLRALDVSFGTLDFNAHVETFSKTVSSFLTRQHRVLLMSATSPTEVFQGFEGDLTFGVGPVFAFATHVILFDGYFDSRLTLEGQLESALQTQRGLLTGVGDWIGINAERSLSTQCEVIRLVTRGLFEDHIVQCSAGTPHLFDSVSGRWLGFPAVLDPIPGLILAESVKSQLVLAQAECSLWPVFAEDIDNILAQYITSAPMVRARDAMLGLASRQPVTVATPDFWFEYFAPFKSKIEMIVSKFRLPSTAWSKKTSSVREGFYHRLLPAAPIVTANESRSQLIQEQTNKKSTKRAQASMNKSNVDSSNSSQGKRLRTMMADSADLDSRHSWSVASLSASARQPAVEPIVSSITQMPSRDRLRSHRDLVLVTDTALLNSMAAFDDNNSNSDPNGVKTGVRDETTESDESDLESMEDISYQDNHVQRSASERVETQEELVRRAVLTTAGTCGLPRAMYSALPETHPAHFTTDMFLSHVWKMGVVCDDQASVLVFDILARLVDAVDCRTDNNIHQPEVRLLLGILECNKSSLTNPEILFTEEYNEGTVVSKIRIIDSVRLYLCLDAATKINFAALVAIPRSGLPVFMNGQISEVVTTHLKAVLQGIPPSRRSFVAQKFYHHLRESSHLLLPFIAKCTLQSLEPSKNQSYRSEAENSKEHNESNSAFYLAYYILNSKFPL